MYVKVYNDKANTVLELSPSIFIGYLEAHLLVYRQTKPPFLNDLKHGDINWLQFSDASLFDDPCLTNSISFYQPDHLIRFPIEAHSLQEIRSILVRIQNRLLTGAHDIYKPTLSYMLLKIRWLKLKQQLRIKPNGQVSTKMMDLLSAMESNIGREKSVKYYAEKIFVSENYLGELCRSELQLSFKEISNILMTIKILDLFLLSDAGFSDIAFDLGFTDQAHFNNFFKKQLQVTPSEFRKGLRI